MPNQSAQLDRVFQALADPTRRAVLERLGGGPAPVSELAQPFKMALPSFSQHLDVLEECGLVIHARRAGAHLSARARAAERRRNSWMVDAAREVGAPPRPTRRLPRQT